MNRKNAKSKYTEPLSKTVQDLVKSRGGWLNVIGHMTNSFDEALGRVGKQVNCPFPARHGSGGGKGDFRFSDDIAYEGRAICTCMQDRGMSAVELLIEDGIGRDFVSCLLAVKDALDPLSASEFVRKESAPVVRPSEQAQQQVDTASRRKRLEIIARDLVPLSDPSAAPARAYFEKRGIPLNQNILDVRYHPGLEYWEDQSGSDKKVLVGVFPAIVSAFRSKEGRVVNFHRIFITEHGDKAPVSKVKKICAPLPCFRGSAIEIARSDDRVLHITEGVEKGWAIHLATEGSVKAAYSCSTLPKLHVDKAKYDHVVIWSDCDPVNPNRLRQSGDGQYFAWELARRLFHEGFGVTFMMPNEKPTSGKGRDWEDVIVEEGVLDLSGSYYRVQTLKAFAVNGGVVKQPSKAA